MARQPDDSPSALPSSPEPPRAPYVAEELFLMPPVPETCPRCHGCLYSAQEEWRGMMETRCLCCGWRPKPIRLEHEPHKYGAQLPTVTESRQT